MNQSYFSKKRNSDLQPAPRFRSALDKVYPGPDESPSYQKLKVDLNDIKMKLDKVK